MATRRSSKSTHCLASAAFLIDGGGEGVAPLSARSHARFVSTIAFAAPASATVHEITGMFCAGQNANYRPAGITGGSNANNFAKPLFATGFIESVDPAYAGDSGNPPGDSSP